jgi:type III restriction enzyme
MHTNELSNQKARQIAKTMSLRGPQIAALELLTRIYALVQPHKRTDLATAVEQVQGLLDALHDKLGERLALDTRDALQRAAKGDDFNSFQRQFVNLCFALATGVGKTRLMGAFIAWLYQEHNLRHFFVVAPNLTIYRKLVEDFGNPASAKYVFKGISVFATDRPLVITGDDYEAGHGIRDEARAQPTLPGLKHLSAGTVHINVFNIAKLAKDAKPAARGEDAGKPPRIKRLHEYIGQSYFDYLASLHDLVLIMDEAHNYRAEAALTVLDELKPVLGLELTATPFRVKGQKRELFENIAYHYQLRDAMTDGFVKLPEVAYRTNLDVGELKKTEEGKKKLELIKLQDAIALHEETRQHLWAYATEQRKPLVKPFILVVASSIDHAKALQSTIEADDFFGGHYKGKTIRIDSKQGSEEKARNTEELLKVERTDSPVEIVLHVESLEEGWDVTNLYTILPLRAADSPQLVLQSIGRGLRLPYGHRTGDNRVDRLTIVAHDRYSELVSEAKVQNADWTGPIGERDLSKDSPERVKAVVSHPTAMVRAEIAAAAGFTPLNASAARTAAVKDKVTQVAKALTASLDAVAGLGRVGDLNKPEVLKRVVAMVEATIAAEEAAKSPVQQTLELIEETPSVQEIVEALSKTFVEQAIEVPRIIVVPSADSAVRYAKSTLDLRNIGWTPAAQDLVRKNITNEHEALDRVGTQRLPSTEDNLQDYIVRQLHNFDDVRYEDAAEAIHHLADQLVAHLIKVNDNDYDEAEQALLQHEKEAGDLVYRELIAHREEVASNWLKTVQPSFDLLRPAVYQTGANDDIRDFKVAEADKQRIRRYIYGGFKKCAAQFCKFDSDAERRFAVLLEEDERHVIRWMKPKTKQLQLRWRYQGIERGYEPDFIVETADRKWLLEVKADNEKDNPEVLAKAEAAKQWCAIATEHRVEATDKPWAYKLIWDSKIRPGFDFPGLIASN